MNRETFAVGKLLALSFAVALGATELMADDSAALIRQGDKAFAQGAYRDAVAAWEKALQAAESSGQGVIEAKSKLGAGLVMAREPERAGMLLREALDAAKDANNSKLAAAILNDLGNLAASEQSYGDAIKFYKDATEVAG